MHLKPSTLNLQPSTLDSGERRVKRHRVGGHVDPLLDLESKTLNLSPQSLTPKP